MESSQFTWSKAVADLRSPHTRVGPLWGPCRQATSSLAPGQVRCRGYRPLRRGVADAMNRVALVARLKPGAQAWAVRAGAAVQPGRTRLARHAVYLSAARSSSSSRAARSSGCQRDRQRAVWSGRGGARDVARARRGSANRADRLHLGKRRGLAKAQSPAATVSNDLRHAIGHGGPSPTSSMPSACPQADRHTGIRRL
jgi:hypothetical protein